LESFQRLKFKHDQTSRRLIQILTNHESDIVFLRASKILVESDPPYALKLAKRRLVDLTLNIQRQDNQSLDNERVSITRIMPPAFLGILLTEKYKKLITNQIRDGYEKICQILLEDKETKMNIKYDLILTLGYLGVFSTCLWIKDYAKKHKISDSLVINDALEMISTRNPS